MWENKKDIRVLLVQWFSNHRQFCPCKSIDNVCRGFQWSEPWGGDYHWYLVDRGQACWWTSNSAWDSLRMTIIQPKMSVLLRLKKPCASPILWFPTWEKYKMLVLFLKLFSINYMSCFSAFSISMHNIMVSEVTI